MPVAGARSVVSDNAASSLFTVCSSSSTASSSSSTVVVVDEEEVSSASDSVSCAAVRVSFATSSVSCADVGSRVATDLTLPRALALVHVDVLECPARGEVHVVVRARRDVAGTRDGRLDHTVGGAHDLGFGPRRATRRADLRHRQKPNHHRHETEKHQGDGPPPSLLLLNHPDNIRERRQRTGRAVSESCRKAVSSVAR